MPVLEANELNAQKRQDEKKDDQLQELHNIRTKMQQLEIPKEFTPVAVSRMENVRLSEKLPDSDGVVQDHVYALELQSDDNENARLTRLYVLREKELFLIGEINRDLSRPDDYLITMPVEAQDLFRQYVHEGQLDEQYVTSVVGTGKVSIAFDDKKKLLEEKEKLKGGVSAASIARLLGTSENRIITIVEIQDELTMSRIANKNELDRTNLYAVKLGQDSGGVGSNDWVLICAHSNGMIELAMKEDISDTYQDIFDNLGIGKGIAPIQNADLKAGDVKMRSSQSQANQRTYEVDRFHLQNDTVYMAVTAKDSGKTDIVRFYRLAGFEGKNVYMELPSEEITQEDQGRSRAEEAYHNLTGQ